jgi:hypothetical protein
MKKIVTIFLLLASLIFISAGILRSTGYVGTTEKDGGQGCNCHSLTPFNQVIAWIEGPDSVFIGSTANYKFYVTGGPKVTAGFNLTARNGKVYPVDNSTRLLHFTAGDSQLTHRFPLSFTRDTISWNFRYVAPNSVGFDTIFSVANSTNGNGSADNGDRWNFGRKFSIKIHNTIVSVNDNKPTNQDFSLFQNYPNPFNPETKIFWYSPINGHQTLKVFDIEGNEIATLIDEYKESGYHTVHFNVKNNNLASGVYLYQLRIKKLSNESVIYTNTKKMILMK